MHADLPAGRQVIMMMKMNADIFNKSSRSCGILNKSMLAFYCVFISDSLNQRVIK